MNVKRKILGILVCMLMLTTIPLAAGGMNDKSPEPETTELIGRAIVRGFFMNPEYNGNDIEFRAIRIHYTVFTGTETAIGIVRLKKCEVKNGLFSNIHTFGPLNNFGYIIGFYQGGIDIKQ